MTLEDVAIMWRKWKKVRYIFILLGLAAGVYLMVSNLQPEEAYQPQQSKSTEDAPVIGRIGEGYFNFEIVDTPELRTKGLSGRNSLPDTDAMLFVFEEAGRHCFWMKDMKFSIDILWFDADRKLVYEKRNASPQSYPESFCPDKPSKYVAEVAAGVAGKNQIKIDDMLDVEL